MAKIPNKISMQQDLRDVRGASIRPSVKIPSKMDKAKDAKRMRREPIEVDENEEMPDVDTQLWEIFDYLSDNLTRYPKVEKVYCAEEFPPTLKVILDDGEFELPIEILTDDYDVMDKQQLMYGKMEDQGMAKLLNEVKKFIRGWDYASNVKSIEDDTFGPSIYFENDYGMKFNIGIINMSF